MTDDSNTGGGPNKYIAVRPCPDGNGQVTLSLPVPAAILEGATEEQRRMIARIQIAFAHRVSRVLARSYGEIASVVGLERKTNADRDRV